MAFRPSRVNPNTHGVVHMAEILRAGVIGAGIGSYHVEGYEATEGVQLAAVCDVDAKRARAIAKPAGATVFTDYTEMLTQAGLDMVSVCVPNHLHADVAIACLKAGTHVLCEKPPAMTVKEVDTMIQAATDTGRHLTWGFNNRFRPEAVYLKELARQGYFGDIYYAKCGWVRNHGIPGWGGWFTQRKLAGGGPAIDLGVHMLDLTLWLMDYPAPIEVMGTTFAKFGPDRDKLGPWGKPATKTEGVFDVEDLAVGSIRFDNGQWISLEASWASHIDQEWIYSTLAGTNAGASLERVFEEDGNDDTSIDTLQLFCDIRGKATIEDVEIEPDPKMGRVEGVRQFAEAMVRGEEPPVPVQEGRTLMLIINALYQSDETKASLLDDQLAELAS